MKAHNETPEGGVVVYVPQRHVLTWKTGMVAALILLLFAGAFLAVRLYNDPLNVATREEAVVLRKINEKKLTIEQNEQRLKQAESELAALQSERAEIEKRKIEAANRGVKDTRPIKIDPAITEAFQSAGK